MRLQSKEIQTIIQIAKDIYGETVQVYLFGSRLNDEKRGGDIDLLVRSTGEKKGVLALFSFFFITSASLFIF